MSEQPQKQRTGTEVLESIENLLEKIAVATQPAPLRKRESEDVRELYKALKEAQKAFQDVNKSGFIAGRNIPYAKINDLVEASRQALYANNLAVTTYHTVDAYYNVKLTTRLFHAPSGQYIESELPLLNATDEQKRGSSITYAWRYTYAPILGLVDNSCDDDGEVTKKPTGKTS
jgi:hypothetical protein